MTEILHCWDVHSLRVLTAYKANTDLRVDFYGNLNSNSNLADCMSRFAFLVNGEDWSEDVLSTLSESIALRASEQYRRLQSLSDEETKGRFLATHCYFEKELLGVGGLDWHPSSFMREAILGKELLPEIADWNNGKVFDRLLNKALAAALNP